MSDQLSTNPKAYLVSRVNAKVNLQLTADEVTFSEWTVVDPTVTDFTDPAKRNSRVRVRREATETTPAADVEVLFNRWSLERLFAMRSQEFPDQGFTQLVQYLPAINARLNTPFTAADIVDVAVVAGAPVQLQAAPNSFYVIGSVELTFSSTPAT